MTVEAPPVPPGLRAAGVVAVLRAPSADAAVLATDALVRGGITGIEITYSTPDAAVAMTRVVDRYGDGVLLGAGTVLTPEHAAEAAEAGAAFLVSPGADETLAAGMRATGAALLLGALTPTEVMVARRLGSAVVKLFPASLGGPSYLRALRGPFPTTPLMPTGGVTADNLGEWYAAGAVAVGAGSELCSPRAMAEGRWDEIEAAARRFAAALAAVPDALRAPQEPA